MPLKINKKGSAKAVLCFRLPLFCLGLCLLSGLAFGQQGKGGQRYAFSHPQMGTTFNIVLYAPTASVARQAAKAAFARIDTLNQHLSDYQPDSEIRLLAPTAGTGRAVAVSPALWTVLEAAQRIARQTKGAFDVTVGPITRLWRWAWRRNQLPPPERLAEAMAAVGYRNLCLDSLNQTVMLKKPGILLDLGGIAKGFAADEALRVLQTFGIESALVDAGGDLVAGQPPPGRSGWQVQVSTVDPRGKRIQETRLLAHRALATSGDTYRFIEVDGVRYSHIVDPRTGLGVTHQRLVTVAAPTGMEADALASAASVLRIDEVESLVAEDIALRLIKPENGRDQLEEAGRFEALIPPDEE